MAYLATAPLVLAKDQNGKVRYHYEGAVIPWLSDEQAEHFTKLGFVEKVADVEPESAAAYGVQPKKTAPQPAWVEYAVSKGASRDEVTGLKREDLVELYGDG